MSTERSTHPELLAPAIRLGEATHDRGRQPTRSGGWKDKQWRQ
jgi:hypothetical protein